MDLCIKTIMAMMVIIPCMGFNPCFNGSMYKNQGVRQWGKLPLLVSILVLMDLCIKTMLLCQDVLNKIEFQSLF